MKVSTRYGILALVFLSPILFWTLTPNFFSTPKQLLLVAVLTLALFSYFVTTLTTKVLVIPKSSLVAPILAFLSAIILNLAINSEGRPEAITGKGLILLSLPLLSLLLLTLKDKINFTKHIATAFIVSTGILAIHSLIQLSFGPSLTFLPSFMQSRSFTLTGSVLTTLTLILIGLFTSLSLLKSYEAKLHYYLFGHIALSVITIFAGLALLLPGGSLALDLIPYRESWSITLDALKTLRSLFAGVGLSNYSLLYSAVKPLSLNLTPLWNTLPQTGTSELLTMLATTGITGGLTLIWLMLAGFKLGKHNLLSSPISIIFILTSLSLVFLPGTVPLYTLFFVSLSVLDHKEGHMVELSKNSSLAIGVIGIILTLTTFVYSLKPIVAEYYMKQAQVALANSDGKAVYDNNLKAISWYPSISIYHLSYADINLNLASALSQKTDLTEADRQTISTLISQSIREAKTAIQLRSSYSLSWQALAKIYRNLINVAEGADTLAIEYYGRAIALDPANPLLRVEYGGLFHQLASATKDDSLKLNYYSRAKSEFQTAIQLRPNYSNAYYNLSKVFESEKDITNAYLAMQKAVSNLDTSSPEYDSAVLELESLKSKLPKSTTPTTQPSSNKDGELTTPSPLPSPLPGGPIEIDK